MPFDRDGFPIPGTQLLVDGKYPARLKARWPKGTSSFLFPHYKVDFEGGDENVAVHMSRVKIAEKG